jgi:hypothetical protein
MPLTTLPCGAVGIIGICNYSIRVRLISYKVFLVFKRFSSIFLLKEQSCKGFLYKFYMGPGSAFTSLFTTVRARTCVLHIPYDR